MTNAAALNTTQEYSDALGTHLATYQAAVTSTREKIRQGTDASWSDALMGTLRSELAKWEAQRDSILSVYTYLREAIESR